MAEERWYYNDAGTSVGPFTRQRLLELARAHLILPSTPVWRNGMIDWAPMAEAVHEGRSEGLDPPRLEPPVERAYPEPVEPDEAPAAISDERGWSTLPVAPWRRYGARAIDTSINGLLGVMLLAYAWYSLAPRSADDFFSLVETPGGLLLDLVLTTFIAAIVGGFVARDLHAIRLALDGFADAKLLPLPDGTIRITGPLGPNLMRDFRAAEAASGPSRASRSPARAVSSHPPSSSRISSSGTG
ncbi:MAG: DUF4339 domain-containing protein [Geminicoccaceae bacterium]